MAGNNPNILEGVFATERDEEVDDIHFLGLRFGLAFPSCYKTAWQWRRGHVKKDWINKIIDTYSVRDVDHNGEERLDKDMEKLHDTTTLLALDWIFIVALMAFLVYVPCVLAFLTSFFTPPIGIACRALTTTIYSCSQCGQVLLWFWANLKVSMTEVDKHRLKQSHMNRKQGWLEKSGFFHASSVSWIVKDECWDSGRPWLIMSSKRFWTTKMMWCVIYHFLAVMFGLGAVFSVLGGTTSKHISETFLPFLISILEHHDTCSESGKS